MNHPCAAQVPPRDAARARAAPPRRAPRRDARRAPPQLGEMHLQMMDGLRLLGSVAHEDTFVKEGVKLLQAACMGDVPNELAVEAYLAKE